MRIHDLFINTTNRVVKKVRYTSNTLHIAKLILTNADCNKTSDQNVETDIPPLLVV